METESLIGLIFIIGIAIFLVYNGLKNNDDDDEPYAGGSFA